jgi:pancreatic triacylglycerol lipase
LNASKTDTIPVAPSISGRSITDPYFNPESDINLLLFTRQNPSTEQQIFQNIDSISSSNFNSSKEVRFIVHGWLESGRQGFSIDLKDAFLKAVDTNVVIIDWGAGANTINYVAARRRVGGVAGVIARFVDFLHDNFDLHLDRVSMAGHSLGAHIIGLSGKQIQRGQVNVLFGLDPAGFLFNIDDPTTRISSGDARYVEIIHTDIGIVGMGGHIGDASFFPNGGSNQPGGYYYNKYFKRISIVFYRLLFTRR